MTNVKFKVPMTNRIVHLCFDAKKGITLDDTRLGIDSGPAKGGWHYCFFDYDGVRPEEDYMVVMKKEGHRRALVVESSPGRWHVADFTKRKWQEMLGVMSLTKSDNKHKFCTLNSGYSTLRISPSNGVRPKLYKVLENPEGTKFYNYDEEKIYLDLIAGLSPDMQKVMQKCGLAGVKLGMDKTKIGV